MWRGGLGAAYLFPALSAPVPHEPDHAPFPHPVRQTGRADFPHPAFTLSIWLQALESERLRNFGEGRVSANALAPDSHSGEEGRPPGTADSRWDRVHKTPALPKTRNPLFSNTRYVRQFSTQTRSVNAGFPDNGPCAQAKHRHALVRSSRK
jgi:hypothetical protein